MNNPKGVIHLALPLLLLLAFGAGIFVLLYFGVIKNPLKDALNKIVPGGEPTVELEGQYQNPFDKNAQYVNPFSRYKNPFDAL